jgi:peroxiredoxin
MTPNRSKPTRARAGRTLARPVWRGRPSRTPWIIGGLVALALIGLFVIYRAGAGGAGTGAGNARFEVGSPGIGAMAPEFLLPDATAPSATGGLPPPVKLSAYRGKTVLLYFHEGLGCQPCWDQIRDLQKDPATLASVGADELLTITTGPLDLVAQKMRDERLTAPALVDTDLRVSQQYQANQYGMMGTSRDGHSFILVGPDGRIQWRADYGGAPNYTMYVPVEQLLADLRAGRKP